MAISGAPATFWEVRRIALVAHGERRNLFLGISILRSNESLPATPGVVDVDWYVEHPQTKYVIILSFAKILSAFEINSIASVAFTRVLV